MAALSHGCLAFIWIPAALVLKEDVSREMKGGITGCLSSSEAFTWHHALFRPIVFTGLVLPLCCEVN